MSMIVHRSTSSPLYAKKLTGTFFLQVSFQSNRDTLGAMSVVHHVAASTHFTFYAQQAERGNVVSALGRRQHGEEVARVPKRHTRTALWRRSGFFNGQRKFLAHGCIENMAKYGSSENDRN